MEHVKKRKFTRKNEKEEIQLANLASLGSLCKQPQREIQSCIIASDLERVPGDTF